MLAALEKKVKPFVKGSCDSTATKTLTACSAKLRKFQKSSNLKSEMENVLWCKAQNTVLPAPKYGNTVCKVPKIPYGRGENTV